MADETTDDSQKTEDPTAKRLQESRKQGQVPLSREVNHWVMLIASAFVLLVMGPGIMSDFGDLFRSFVERPHILSQNENGPGYVLASLFVRAGEILFMPMVIMVIAAIGAPLVQIGPLFSAETIKPKLSKISPIAGAKRLFSIRSVVEFLKTLFKMAIIGTVTVILMMPFYGTIEHFIGLPIAYAMDELHSLIFRMMVGIISILTVIAVIDLIYQRMEHMKKLRMSKQEIKDEFKQTEGDPQVKARLSELRQTRAQQRMMSAVPEADVVITNPTHYAVALKYDPQQMDAPIMVAKGIDETALRIREVAKEHNITIVENPPLARGLFDNMDIDEIIPGDFFKAVAEVISYVFKLKGKKMS
ncbi:MAG: flagellar biosynthesis protein FlhB [Pseudomonadota bacterium]